MTEPPKQPDQTAAAPGKPDRPAWWTPKELGALFRVTPSAVTKWCANGDIPGAIRLPGGNKLWRIPDATVRKLENGELDLFAIASDNDDPGHD